MSKVIMGAVIGAAVIILGIVAVLFGVAKGVSDAADHVVETVDDDLHGGKASPTSVEVGKEFTHGALRVEAGWTAVENEYGSLELAGDVVNVGDRDRAAWMTFKFLQGNRVVASASCSTDELAPGQVASMECTGLDEYPKSYDAVEVTALF